MATNKFESSRISEGTLNSGANHIGTDLPPVESKALSRDDVRDGFATAEDPGTGRLDANGKRWRRVLAASTLIGDRVRNSKNEDLGKIEDLMIDLKQGRVAYAVLSFGGFLGIGDKLFAVPWRALRLDEEEHKFIFDIDREVLADAPGFDRENWPDMANPAFEQQIDAHYAQRRVWEHDVTDAGDFIGDDQYRDRSKEFEPTSGYKAGGGNSGGGI